MRGHGGSIFYGGPSRLWGALDSVFLSTCHQNFSPAAHQKSYEMYGGMGGDPHNKITLVYFPCLQSNNYLAQNTHLETKIYQFLKKLSSMAVYLVFTQTWQKCTSTTFFWIQLKLWVRDENYCHWGNNEESCDAHHCATQEIFKLKKKYSTNDLQ